MKQTNFSESSLDSASTSSASTSSHSTHSTSTNPTDSDSTPASPKNNALEPQMPRFVFIASSLLFACIVVLANYTVQYNVLDTPLTYGALTYPLSFLLMDVLSEKYSKPQVLKTLWLGLLLAFVPSMLAAEPRIAIASVCAFFISQNLDIHIFFYLKNRFPSLWWLRNNASTMASQFIDTMIFFHIAFLFVMPLESVWAMLLADFSMKVLLALLDTPFFYALAIKGRNLYATTPYTKMSNLPKSHKTR